MEKEKIRLHCNGKDRYQENSHPEKFPPIKLPPGKFPPGIFQPMFLNIPTRVFNFFVFSLLWPPSLILLKRLFSNSIIHLFVLGDFIFEASHEECDVTKFISVKWSDPGHFSESQGKFFFVISMYPFFTCFWHLKLWMRV